VPLWDVANATFASIFGQSEMRPEFENEGVDLARPSLETPDFEPRGITLAQPLRPSASMKGGSGYVV
jgi:hypothetical protein